MSKMCLIVTPAIEELANKIRQEYPEACERNGFNNQMCAEWIGLYNDANSKNPDDVPAMKSLINFIEKLRNNEGMSFLRDFKAEERQRAIEQEMQDIKAKAIANGTFMKAPNGKDTNLTEKQWLQVRTKNFINWFGDWMNNPTSASKVVDENGEPLVVYHFTPNASFSTYRKNPNGLHFTKDPIGENIFAPNINPYSEKHAVFLNIKNPAFEIGGRYVTNKIYLRERKIEKRAKELQPKTSDKKILEEWRNLWDEIADLRDLHIERTLGEEAVALQKLREKDPNVDGVLREGAYQYSWENFIAFEPNQIKSATDNNGEFSTENDVIFASPQAYEEIPVELMGEIADNAAAREAFDTRESSDPDLNKKFSGKTEVTVSEILNNLLNNNSPFEGFIKSLVDNIGEIGNIKVKLVPNSQSRGQAGLYDAIENTIYINRNASYKGKDGKVDNTIVHEIVHAIVANSLNTPKHREELNKIFEDAREKILKKYGVNSFDELPENLKNGKLYGLQNLDEFAAEFFTNSEFISELNDENTFGKRSDKKSIISRLVEWIKSLLPKGVTETYKRSGEILEDILLNSGGTIQTLEDRRMLGKDVIAANTQNLPGPEIKINIYAGTGENAELSNFAERPFTIPEDFSISVPSGRDISHGTIGINNDGSDIKYRSVEAAFQGIKAAYSETDYPANTDFDSLRKQGKALRIEDFAKMSGAEAKKNGRNITDLDKQSWDKDSSTIMKALLKLSFEQNPQALQRLLATGNATLTHTQDRGKWGTEFPRLLMEVRDELRGTSQQQPTSTIDPRFKQGIRTLGAYFEGGGRVLSDDFPAIPDELFGKLGDHFMDGKELSDDDYRELAKYVSVVEDSNNQGRFIAVPKQQTQTSKPTAFTESIGGYQQRTDENAAWSDITLALATDFTTAGEIRTAKAAGATVENKVITDKGDSYVSEKIDKRIFTVSGLDRIAESLYKQIVNTGKVKNIKLNIAGNGIYNLDGYPQESLNERVTMILQRLIDNGITISEIRSGGQTGIDEAGIIAAQRLGIPASVHAPNGWVFRDANNKEHYGKAEFISRFGQPVPTQQSTLKSNIDAAIKEHQGFWSRTEAEKHPRTLYVFTDNLDRDSGSGIILPGSWYSKRYGVGHHYPSSTAAVVRGLDNARPISTMHYFYKSHGYAHPKYNRDSKALWHDSDVEEFKKVVRSELQDIVDEFNTGRYDTIMFPSGDGLFNTELSNITKYRTPELYKALVDLLHEFGFDSLIPKDAQVSSQSSESASLAAGTATFGTAPTAEQQAEAQRKYEEANTPKPKPVRPQSDAFESALKVTDNPIARFYQTFTPQQIKDRGTMIADYFSDIIDDYILDELDRLNDIIEDDNKTAKEKEEARKLRNLLRDPINGRQYAVGKIQINNILDQIKDKIRRNVNSHDGAEKQLWQNTLNFFDELFNNQASLEIEEQEGIRIVGLQMIEKSPDDVANDEASDGDDDTGHTVSGNDGWIFQVRFEDPAASLSKKVRRMLCNVKRSSEDKDDLGHTRKYSSGQIYATLLSYLAKTMEDPDAFMQVTKLEDYGDDLYDHYGNQVTKDLYPYGYPTFPVLEKMRDQYPWVEQIINRLTDDYLDAEWNTCIAYPSTYGAMASQFYTNFRKVFIPYAKIQVGEGKFGITPLNTEMEARCQQDKLSANYNNGIVLTDTGIYNTDKTINREHAADLMDFIKEVTDNDGVEHAYRLYKDISDENTEVDQEDIEEFDLFINRAVFILNSFGISSNRENVIALLAQEEQGQVFLDMMKDLHYIADTISKVSDENAKDYNYLVDPQYVGGRPLWKDFFNNRGLITDESYMQSFYDSATKKTRYSYSADNYIQKTFRGLYNPDINKRRKFIEDNYMKYEWFYNHKTNTWRNKWLEHLYNAQDITDEIPYRNINNITDYDEGKVRDYTKWTPDDIWLVQNRSYRGDSAYSYYLAPIFSDSPMSMTVKGPVLSSAEVLDALVGLIDQEMWRIKYVNDRAKAIERGDVKEIANFDGKRGKEFCFIPELNTFTFENGETLLQVLNRMKEGKDENGNRRVYTSQEIDDVKKNAILQIMAQKATEYLNENSEHYSGEIDSEAFLRSYMNMVYANASIIQFTTIDLAFYKNDTDFQKRFKEVYAGGIQLNTNSRFGKKTENTFLIADDIITSPSYTTIAGIVNGSKKLTEKDKEHILGIFTDINVADAQAIRAMHSFRSVMDMMGRWDERAQEALEHFEKGEWNREDFDVIYQIIKPFVYTVIDRNDGFGGVIPVPQQHKNSEICALMMYNLITNDLKSPVYEALSEFMDLKDANGEYLTDMAQFESGGKVGNQGVINISFNPENVIKAISKQWDDSNKKDREIKDLLDKYDLDTAQIEVDGKPRFLPNDADNAEANYKAIKKQLDKTLKAEKISQEDYKKIINYLRPTKDEIISILKQKVLVTNEDGSLSINPEVVHTIPFDNYYQAQPTPEHHLDAEATFGSQARNIGVADLPEDFELTLTVKGNKTITLKGRDAVIDFYYELLDENLIEDFYGDGKKKKGLKGVFESKESLRAAVEEIVRGNPKYGKDFVDALKTDSDGNFTLPPNSPTMFTLMQELVTSLFKNRITKQKINGAALIQAAGIGLDDKLRLVRDENGNIAGAQCLMPLTSKKFFEPFLVEREINGKKVMMLDPDKLEAAGLNRALGYRIPTENKSSMLPLIITGFTPLQNGSCIILPAEITALAGSDFDVDKMYVMLSEFYIQNYNMKEAREAWADENYLTTSVFSNPDLEDEVSDEDPEEFRKWFNKNKSKYELDKPVVKRVEYDFSKSPKENGRKARNNMLIQILYNILTSRAGNESLLNPQGFDNFKGAAKLNRIINDPALREQLMKNYAASVSDVVPSAEQIRSMFLDNYKDMDADTLNDLKKSLMSMTDEQVIQAYIEATVAGKEGDGSVIDFLLDSSLEDREEFIKKYSVPESPIYPQTFAHSHARNMAGNIQIGIYAIQGSMAAKYQRAHVTLRERQQFKLNGRTIKDVDVSENGKRLKRVGEMIGASADNGKDPNLSDAGSTSKTASIIGYMLRLGLTHEEAVLIINQPCMKNANYDPNRMCPEIKKMPVGDVSTKTLIKAILSPMSVSPMETMNIMAMCYRILKQAKAMEGLTMISRADSPNGAMQNSFAKARVQQYMVEKFNAQMGQNDFPFNNIKEVINNTAIDVSKGENDVREKLKAQPMAFLHAMYALGINSLGDLASPYFFMLSEHFDDSIVKPILYNQNSDYKETLEDIVNKIYLQYITYVLSSSPLFGDETNADGTVTTMKEKRDYYLNSFADDFAKTLQEHKEIHNLLGSILQRDGNRVVLRDVGSLAKGQKDVISRRFDALFTLGDENSELREAAQKLAKDLLLYSYYDSGLNFTHDSFSSRLSTYFLSQFPVFRDILLQLDNPLTEEQEQRFIYQFLLNNKEAAYNVNNKVNRDEDIIGEDIVIDMNNWKKNKDFTNVILSPKPRMEGIHPYPYITFDNEVYYLDEDAYDLNPASAVYHKLEDFTTHDTRAIYNMNKSTSQLADEYNGVQPQQAPQEQNIDEDTHPGIAHNTSDDNPAIDNSGDGFDFDVPDFDDFSGIDDVETPSPYNDQDTLQDPMCTNKK